eukprot:12886023-Prorocentrum_lima.AAC.1
MTDMEEKHDGADPSKWRWGDGTPCADVFAADEAKRRYEEFAARAAFLRQPCGNAARTGVTRDRSRSPRRPEGQ